MIKIENDCVGGCGDTGFGCRGSSCPLRHVPHYYCDVCGVEMDFDEYEDHEGLCNDCFKEAFGEDSDE